MAVPYFGHVINDRVADKTNYIGRIDSRPTVAGFIAIYNVDGVQLSKKQFSIPSGTVDTVTGVATLTVSGVETPAINGVADYAVIYDGYGSPHTYFKCVQGYVAPPGQMALATLTIVADVPVVYQDIIF